MLVGITLNIQIALIFIISGLAIKAFIWMRLDDYSLPDTSAKIDHSQNKNKPYKKENYYTYRLKNYKSIYLYYKDLLKVVFRTDPYTLINRYGYESLVYLEFHKSFGKGTIFLALSSILFLVVTGLVNGLDPKSIFEAILGGGLDKRTKDYRNRTFESTIIMTLTTFCFSWSAFQTVTKLNHLLKLKAKKVSNNINDPYYHTFTTGMVSLRNSEPNDAKQMLLFLKGVQCKVEGKARLEAAYGLKDMQSVIQKLISIDDSVVMINLWPTKVYGHTVGYM